MNPLDTKPSTPTPLAECEGREIDCYVLTDEGRAVYERMELAKLPQCRWMFWKWNVIAARNL